MNINVGKANVMNIAKNEGFVNGKKNWKNYAATANPHQEASCRGSAVSKHS